MNTSLTWLSSPLVDRIGWALIHFLWQATAIAALLGFVLRLLNRRSANARYRAAWIGLLAMTACLPLTAWLVPVSRAVDVSRPVAESPPPLTANGAGLAGSEGNTLSPISPITGRIAAAKSVTGRQADLAEVDYKSHAPADTRLTGRLASILQPWLRWVVVAWVVGAMALSVWHFGGWLRVLRLRRVGTCAVPEAVRQVLLLWKERLQVRGSVQVLASWIVGVPAAVGWLRPIILLPVSVLSELPQQQLEVILAHELAHVRRCDYLLNLLQTAIETLLFYHPAVWWASGRIRQEREECCDDVVLATSGNRLTYARALTRLAELREEAAHAVPAGLVLAASGGLFRRRIRRILGMPLGRDVGSRAGLPGMLVVLLAATLIGAIVWPGDRRTGDNRAEAAELLKQHEGTDEKHGFEAAKPEKTRAVAPNPEEARAVIEIRKLGGETTADEQRPGKPVIAVNFKSIRVNDADLALLKSLPQLRSLRMGGRQLTDGGLAHLQGLTQLEELTIRQTQITGAGLAHLPGLTRLKTLDIGCNKIGDAGLAHLKGMTHLERLNLIATGITDAGLEHLQNLTQLQWLDLSHNTIRGTGLAHLKGLSHLQELELGDTRDLTESGWKQLSEMPHLRAIKYFGVPVERGLERAGKAIKSDSRPDASVDETAIRAFLSRVESPRPPKYKPLGRYVRNAAGQITGLSLREAVLQTADFPVISQLHDLRFLDLTGTNVSDNDLRHLKGLENLRRLVLRRTKIGDAGLASLAALAHLESLELGVTQVTDEGLRHLKGLATLRGLTLEETNVSDAGMKYLAESPSLVWILSPRGTAEEFVRRIERGDWEGVDDMCAAGPFIPDEGKFRLEKLVTLEPNAADRKHHWQRFHIQMHWIAEAPDLHVNETFYADIAVDRGAVIVLEDGIGNR